MARTDELREVVNELWQQAVKQLEDVKAVLTRSRTRLEDDLLRLRHERDRLLKKLGEQTLRLAEQESVPLPTVVRNTVQRLNQVIDRIVQTEAQHSTAAPEMGKKSSARARKRTTRKKVTKKTTNA